MIKTQSSSDGSNLTISISGRFDFSSHKEFKDAYEDVPRQPSGYTVDMQETSYLDSSALGMLLLLRDHAGGDSAEISIVHCSPDVRKILNISNFQQLFKIP